MIFHETLILHVLAPEAIKHAGEPKAPKLPDVTALAITVIVSDPGGFGAAVQTNVNVPRTLKGPSTCPPSAARDGSGIELVATGGPAH